MKDDCTHSEEIAAVGRIFVMLCNQLHAVEITDAFGVNVCNLIAGKLDRDRSSRFHLYMLEHCGEVEQLINCLLYQQTIRHFIS
jgi:hypothetical protein